jgi:thioredoxin-related protein
MAVPLRQIDARRPWPKDLSRVLRPRATPIFILVEEGREIGRFAGYVSPDDFFAKLERLVAKL